MVPNFLHIIQWDEADMTMAFSFQTAVRCLAISPNGKTLAAGMDGGAIFLLNVNFEQEKWDIVSACKLPVFFLF